MSESLRDELKADGIRLRYPVKGGLMLAIHALLPDALWRALLGAGMNRRPKERLALTSSKAWIVTG